MTVSDVSRTRASACHFETPTLVYVSLFTRTIQISQQVPNGTTEPDPHHGQEELNQSPGKRHGVRVSTGSPHDFWPERARHWRQ